MATGKKMMPKVFLLLELFQFGRRFVRKKSLEEEELRGKENVYSNFNIHCDIEEGTFCIYILVS